MCLRSLNLRSLRLRLLEAATANDNTQSIENRVGAWLLPILLIVTLALYFSTLDTGLQPEELRGGDLITHQYAQVQARPSNAPGYPLYTIGGWLWFHTIKTVFSAIGIVAPNPIPILSSYSTLWAIIAIWLFYRILCRLTRSHLRPAGDRCLAFLLACFYAVTYFFWYYATTTEQYTSTVAQTLAIVDLYLRWSDTLAKNVQKSETAPINPINPQTTSQRLLIALALLCGLALAHMLTVALIVPPLVFVILWQSPQLLRKGWLILHCVLAALLPLLSYCYVYWRGAAHPEWWGNGNWQSATQWFWAFVGTAQGREELAWGLAAGRSFWGGHFPALMGQELSLPFLIFGAIGIARLGRHLATLLYGTIVMYLIFCWLYRFGNWYQVILPVYPLLLLGLVALLSPPEQPCNMLSSLKLALPNLALPHQRRWSSALLLIAILWRFNASAIPANSRQRVGDTALNRAALLLDQPLPHNAALFAAVDDTLALQYLIDIWQLHSDRQTVSSAEAGRVLQRGGLLFSTWEALATLRSELPALSYTLQAQSPEWVALAPSSQSSAQPIENPIRQAIVDGVLFQGYNIGKGASGEPVVKLERAINVTLFWQLATGRWPTGLAISVRPLLGGAYLQVSAENGAIVQQDSAAPMMGLLAHENIVPGSTIADPYRVSLSAENQQSPDQIQVILYRARDGGFEEVALLTLPFKP